MTGVLTYSQVLFPVQLSRLKHHSQQNLPIFMWMFVYTQLSKLHIIASCSALSNLVQRYVEVHLHVHFLLERKAIAWGSKWILGRSRVVWAQMIHAPVSLTETMQIVHNIKWYTSGNPSWPGGGSQLKKWLHNLFRVWQVLQNSEPSFFKLLNDMGKEEECSNVKEI